MVVVMDDMDRYPSIKAMYAGAAFGPSSGREEFRSPDGFACLIRRTNIGIWCGYVAVPPGHPWHGKHYDAVDADVHGGLTYAEPCSGEICHVPQPGESDDVWWLGFDCGHYFSKNVDVRAETLLLAEQATRAR